MKFCFEDFPFEHDWNLEQGKCRWRDDTVWVTLKRDAMLLYRILSASMWFCWFSGFRIMSLICTPQFLYLRDWCWRWEPTCWRNGNQMTDVLRNVWEPETLEKRQIPPQRFLRHSANRFPWFLKYRMYQVYWRWLQQNKNPEFDRAHSGKDNGSARRWNK